MRNSFRRQVILKYCKTDTRLYNFDFQRVYIFLLIQLYQPRVGTFIQ